jgi:hypothetical protein
MGKIAKRSKAEHEQLGHGGRLDYLVLVTVHSVPTHLMAK